MQVVGLVGDTLGSDIVKDVTIRINGVGVVEGEGEVELSELIGLNLKVFQSASTKSSVVQGIEHLCSKGKN